MICTPYKEIYPKSNLWQSRLILSSVSVRSWLFKTYPCHNPSNMYLTRTTFKNIIDVYSNTPSAAVAPIWTVQSINMQIFVSSLQVPQPQWNPHYINTGKVKIERFTTPCNLIAVSSMKYYHVACCICVVIWSMTMVTIHQKRICLLRLIPKKYCSIICHCWDTLSIFLLLCLLTFEA